jgi:Ca2+-binding RTX toxin-like protein
MGSSGNDHSGSGCGDDRIMPMAGDDWFHSGAGADTIVDHDGHDTFMGGAGDDLIASGAGNDGLFTGAGNDTVFAGDGDDIIVIGRDNFLWESVVPIGNDRVEGGAGDDRLHVHPTSGHVTFDGGAGRDTIALQLGPNGWLPDTLKLSAPGTSWARDAAGDIVFTGPSSGTITWGDTVITFTNVEKIEMPRA